MSADAETSKQIETLKRKVKQLERDNRMLGVMNQNIEVLRNSFESEKNLQYFYNDLLLQNCPNMIFVFNEQHKLELFSRACVPFLSYREHDDLFNIDFRKVFINSIDQAWVNKIYQQSLEAFENKYSFNYDDTLIFDNKDVIHVQISISPVVDDAGICRGTLLNINDVTELVIAKHKMEDAAHSKSRFLANMSHEIRTPMNAVKGLSELLALTKLNPVQKSYVNNIINASDSLLSIINDILDFSKIDANKIELVEVAYNLYDLIAGVCNVVNIKADEKKLDLIVDVEAKLPVSLIGDEVRIKQIMTNFLTNAVKYTNQGYVRLILRMEYEDGKNYLVCGIEDTGIGIQEDHMAELFHAFSRVDLHTNRHISGTGLGLAISKQLAVAMGGDVFVESEYGKGSTFGFKIPQRILNKQPIAEIKNKDEKNVLVLEKGIRLWNIVDMLKDLGVSYTHISDENDLVKLDAESKISFTHCIVGISISKKIEEDIKYRFPNSKYAELKNMNHVTELSEYRGTVFYLPLLITDLAEFIADITYNELHDELHDGTKNIKVAGVTALVVDDNEINLIVGSEMLMNFGVDVECADSGKEAIELCRHKQYDIIFMDQMMPEMDGVETVYHIREIDEHNRSVSIIALTANVLSDMKEYYLSNQMDDFIGKPMELSDIRRVLLKWIPKNKVIIKS